MKLALVTLVTANLEQMCTFYQAVLQIEPRIYRGNYVEFTLETGALVLWRQSECAAYGLGVLRGAANDRVLIECEVADVDGEYARLQGLQVEWVQELMTQPWGRVRGRAVEDRERVRSVHNIIPLSCASPRRATDRGEVNTRSSLDSVRQ